MAKGDPGPRGVRRGGEDPLKRRERMRMDQKSGLKCDKILGLRKAHTMLKQLERDHVSLHVVEIASMRYLKSPCNSIRRLDIKRW